MCHGKVRVVTTTTDIAWLLSELGGNQVQVDSLLNGSEDPHFIDAMPHFISKVSRADIFCQVGLELELGWAPKILKKSGNQSVQPGGAGFCDVGSFIEAIDIPKGKIDRSGGDVHASGNPHFHLSPSKMIQASNGVVKVLTKIDPPHKSFYLKNHVALKQKLNQIKEEVSSILKPFKKKKFMEYHKEFSYFMKEYGLENEGSIESVPGVPPSAGRIARVAIQAGKSETYAAFATPLAPKGVLRKFTESSGVPTLLVPLSIMSDEKYHNYRLHQLHIARKISALANYAKK